MHHGKLSYCSCYSSHVHDNAPKAVLLKSAALLSFLFTYFNILASSAGPQPSRFLSQVLRLPLLKLGFSRSVSRSTCHLTWRSTFQSFHRGLRFSILRSGFSTDRLFLSANLRIRLSDSSHFFHQI